MVTVGLSDLWRFARPMLWAAKDDNFSDDNDGAGYGTSPGDGFGDGYKGYKGDGYGAGTSDDGNGWGNGPN